MGNYGIYETYTRKNLSPIERRAVLIQHLLDLYKKGFLTDAEHERLCDEAIRSTRSERNEP